MPITQLEELEAQFKSLVAQLVDRYSGNPDIAIEIARIQKDMGLLRKYKSYGIKCCTPLGYSIFLLNEGEGFSFQNHLEFKVELFHILSVLPGGYVFICTADEWKEAFDRSRFERWLEGESVPALDVFKRFPVSGDLVKIDQTGIVHTAIGCVLEEYANVSTDMVQRLFDQNKGKAIPKKFTRAFVEQALQTFVFPQVIDKVVLHDSSEFVATRVSIDTHQAQAIKCEDEFVSLYVTQGEGELLIDGMSLDPIHLKKGDPVLLVPQTSWKLTSTGDVPLQYSCLRVPKQHALK